MNQTHFWSETANAWWTSKNNSQFMSFDDEYTNFANDVTCDGYKKLRKGSKLLDDILSEAFSLKGRFLKLQFVTYKTVWNLIEEIQTMPNEVHHVYV